MSVVALTDAAHAYMLIDDFTVGPYSRVLKNEETHSMTIKNLDPLHCAFGERQVSTNINANPNNTTLSVTLGGGQLKFESPKPVMWEHTLHYGSETSKILDFSNETEFWVDETTNPEGYFADNWTMYVRDIHGVGSANGGWLHTDSGIRFRKQAFTQVVDWAHIATLEFNQDWDALPNPLNYTVTKFYAVPEPASVLAFSILLPIVMRRAKRLGA